MNKRRWSLVLGGMVAASALAAVAQERLDGPTVLHEFFTGSKRQGGAGGSAGTQPPAQMVEVADATAPPSLSSEAGAGELVYAPDGPLPDARLKEPYGDLSPFGGPNTLDSNTDRVDSLNYFENFDPSIIPYKRVVSQNSVYRSSDGEYVVRRLGTPRNIAPALTLVPDSQIFWGSFLLQMDENRMQPIASVAPHQQILDIQTEPPVRAQVLVDDAGNFLVRAPFNGPLRVNMKIAVPGSYFTGEFLPVSWDDIDGLGLEPLEPDVLRTARDVQAQIGISRAQPPHEVLLELISYFRNFEGRPFPDDQKGDDLFVSIVSEQIGVCRHRSLAFLIVAQSLGIPTQYVYNEAHAFVEIYWPGMGWRRVDLGGAADELNAAAANNRTIHAPPDNLPQPEQFVREQERMVQNGLRPESGNGQGAGDGPQERQGGDAQAGTQADSAGQGNTNGADQAMVQQMAADPDPASLQGGTQQEAQPDLRTPSSLVLLSVANEVKRGAEVSVRGRLSADIPNLKGRQVEVHLGPPGTRIGTRATRIGETTTRVDGSLVAEVRIPESQPVGRWSLFLVFPGDAELAPSFAE